MKNLLPNASADSRRLNPHLFNKNAATGRTGTRRGIRKGMNKTERDFSLILAAQLVKGEISGWMYEGVKLKIGEGCWYCPDFVVFTPRTERSRCIGEADTPMLASVRFIEVKGFLRDDARVKFLSAQEQHKWASFEMWRKTKQGWTQIL